MKPLMTSVRRSMTVMTSVVFRPHLVVGTLVEATTIENYQKESKMFKHREGRVDR
ncbi:hypothetical protein X975_01301, partial [Stegodyphus mimosarum]